MCVIQGGVSRLEEEWVARKKSGFTCWCRGSGADVVGKERKDEVWRKEDWKRIYHGKRVVWSGQAALQKAFCKPCSHVVIVQWTAQSCFESASLCVSRAWRGSTGHGMQTSLHEPLNHPGKLQKFSDCWWCCSGFQCSGAVGNWTLSRLSRQIGLQRWWTGQEGRIRSKRGFGWERLVIDWGSRVGGIERPAGVTEAETNSILHQLLCVHRLPVQLSSLKIN